MTQETVLPTSTGKVVAAATLSVVSRGVRYWGQPSLVRRCSCLFITLLAWAYPSQGQLVNGGFETGSLAPDWLSSGISSITDSTFGIAPVEGTRHALLDTEGSTSAADLETFL